MKPILFMAILLPLLSTAQYDSGKTSPKKAKKTSRGLGIKAGVNFANVRNTSSINTSNQTGFMVGGFFSPPSNGIMGYRSELIYSKQGYNFQSQTNTGNVNLDYIIMPHLMSINVTKFVQLQFGAQIAYLLNAKTDSVKQNPSSPYGNYGMEMYNRFDYGFGAGVELHPISGLLIGARMNFSMANIYKDPSSYMTGPTQSPIPKIEAKNNVLQLFAGWIF